MLLYMLFILNFIFYVLQVYRNDFQQFKNNIYLAVLGLCGCTGFSLVAMSRGCSLVVGYMSLSLWWLLLLCGTSSGVLRLQYLWQVTSADAAPGLWSTGSVVVAYRLALQHVGSSWARD